MIKKLLHHVKKDFKHLKYQFIFWLLLLTVHIVSAEIPDIPNILTVSLKGLLLFIWIPQLIQADTVTGTSTFWATRPVSGIEMFSAKALYIFLFIICTAVMANSIHLGLMGFVPADIFSAELEVIFDMTLIVLPLWLLAALTTTIKNYVLTTVALFFCAIVGIPGAGLFVYRLFMQETIFSYPRILSMLELLLFGGLLIHHYFTRKTKKTVILAIAAIIVLNVLIIWHFSKSGEAGLQTTSLWGSQGVNDIPINVSEPHPLAPDDPRIRDFKVKAGARCSGGGTREDNKGKLYSSFYKASYSGIPKECFITFKAEKDVKIQFPGGELQTPSLLL
ncbi:MAG: hypothetical protein GY757_46640, partial [bacterium]|nr:hypothetical protein [bacterium]